MSVKIPRGAPRIGDAGRLAESRLSDYLGAWLKPASGAVRGNKGDMEFSGHLIEAKSSVRNSIRIEHAWLGKICKEAREQNKKPALTLSFTLNNGRPVPNGEWVCVPLNDWLGLLDLIEESCGSQK